MGVESFKSTALPLVSIMLLVVPFTLSFCLMPKTVRQNKKIYNWLLFFTFLFTGIALLISILAIANNPTLRVYADTKYNGVYWSSVMTHHYSQSEIMNAIKNLKTNNQSPALIIVGLVDEGYLEN